MKAKLAKIRCFGSGALATHHMVVCLWWSLSLYVQTRKMVNYARAGRSQRKLWWRSAAILTCKSIV